MLSERSRSDAGFVSAFAPVGANSGSSQAEVSRGIGGLQGFLCGYKRVARGAAALLACGVVAAPLLAQDDTPVNGNSQPTSLPGSVFNGRSGTATGVGSEHTRISRKAAPQQAPLNPQLVDFAAGLGLAQAVAPSADGQFAYIASTELGVVVVDMSNPDSPSLIASQEVPSAASLIVVENGIAVTADGGNPMRFVQLNTPDLRPFVLSTLTLYPRSIAMRNGHVYAVAGSGLAVINATSPTAPQVSPSIALSSPAFGVCVSSDGRWLYVANGQSGVSVFDISNPVQPAARGLVATTGSANAIAVSPNNQYLYVGGTFGIKALSLANPAAPAIVGSHMLSGDSISSLTVSGSLVAAATTARTSLVSMADPTHPTVTSTAAVGGSCIAFVNGDVIMARGARATRYDVAGTAFGAHADLPVSRSTRTCLASDGQISIIGAYGAPTVVVAYSSSSPRYAAEIPVVSNAAVVRNGMAYLATSSGLVSVNVQNPEAPSICGTLAIAAQDVCFGAGNQLVVASGTSGVSVVSLASPCSPSVQYTIPTVGVAYGVAYDGVNRLCVADGSAGVSLFSINGSAASYLGTAPAPSRTVALKVAMQDGVALMWTGAQAHLYDINLAPVYVGIVSDAATAIAASDHRLYVARNNGTDAYEHDAAGWHVAATIPNLTSGATALCVNTSNIYTAELASPLVTFDLYGR